METSIIYNPDLGAAFLLGLAGGLHCVGMCGGIVAALSVGARTAPAGQWTGAALYHLGRIGVYSLLGLGAGALGGAVAGGALAAQRALGALAGAVMIFFALQVGGWMRDRLEFPVFSGWLSRSMKSAASGRISPHLVVGAANGLLPCGLVYAALALALNSMNAFHGAVLMFAFGLGTAPWLLGLAAAMRLLTPALRGAALKVMAVFLLAFGVFMIYRAAAIGGHEHGHMSQTAPSAPAPARSHAPWDVSVFDDGGVSVFGIRTGVTTAREVMRLMNAEPQLSLFVSGGGSLKTLEAFYGKVRPGGYQGKMVVNLGAPEGWMARAMGRAARVSPTAGGDRKYTLSSDDYRMAMDFPVVAVTFIPAVDLDEATIRARFGKPDRVVKSGGSVADWHYPAKGLVIAVDGEGREALEYAGAAAAQR